MKPNQTTHMIPIVTNARQGRAVSSRNRPRRGRINTPAACMLLALVAFWVAVAFVVACAR